MDDVKNLKELLIMFGYIPEQGEFSQRYIQKGWPKVVFNPINETIVVSSLTHIVLRVRYQYAAEVMDYIIEIAKKKNHG